MDILFLAIIIFSAFNGWQKGFMINMLELFSWFGTLLIAYLLYPGISVYLEKLLPSMGFWGSLITLLFILIIIRAVFSYLIGLILSTVPVNYHHRPGNKISGIFSGFLSGVMYTIVITAILLTMPFSGSSAGHPGGIFIDRLSPKIEWLKNKASAIFDKDMLWPAGMITINPKSEKFIKLGFTVKDVKTRKDLEAAMLKLVNTERQKAGLKALKADEELTALARKYSTEMFARGFFSHYTPEGKSPFDRMRDARVRFITAGENLAIAPGVSMAHNGLMNSPGHKANILRPAFGRVGIGVIEGGKHGLMITQVFRN